MQQIGLAGRAKRLVFCEGTITEPGYLRALERHHGVTSIAAFDIREGGGAPRTLVERAKQAKTEQAGSAPLPAPQAASGKLAGSSGRDRGPGGRLQTAEGSVWPGSASCSPP